MLVGDIASFSQGSNQLKFYNRYKIVEPYFQDDWRVSDRLTLNLGLRLSLFGTYRERYHHAYNWDPAIYNAGAANAPTLDGDGTITGNSGALVPASLGGNPTGNPFLGLTACGTAGGTVPFPGGQFPNAAVGSTSYAGCMQGHLFNPAPRVGFAWDPHGNGKMAIRGGYGIFYEHANGNEADTEGMEGQSSPLLQSSTQLNIVGYQNVGGSSGTAAPSYPLSFLSIPNKAVWPYVQQWHVDVQKELPGHSVMTVAYVGSKGTHLGRQLDLNQLYPVSAAQNPYGPGQIISATDCAGVSVTGQQATAVATPGAGTTYTTLQTGGWAQNLAVACGGNADPYRPYYGVSTITRLENKASSIYHALQVSARKSVGALNLTAAYTYSHSIDDSSDRYDGSFVNSYNPAMTRASSSFDERHMLNVSWIYDLPSLKSKGWTNTVIGGWEWSGIETFATGTPFTITNGTTYGDNAGVGNAVGTGSYADIVGNPRANVPGVSQLFSNAYSKFAYNPAAYAIPQGLTFGNSGRDSLPGPYRINFDMALFKHFAIRESKAFEFRLEGFNVFNHTEWSGYGTGFTCPSAPNGGACLGSGTGASQMFEINSAHLARVVQLAGKFIF